MRIYSNLKLVARLKKSNNRINEFWISSSSSLNLVKRTIVNNSTLKEQHNKNNQIDYDGAIKLHILSNGYMNGSKSCLLRTNSSMYLINIGESVERSMYYNEANIKNVNNLLLTRFDWDCMGGLHGITLNEANNEREVNQMPHFVTHSPVSIDKIINKNTRTQDQDYSAKQHNYNSQGPFQDADVIIKNIEISYQKCYSYLFELKSDEHCKKGINICDEYGNVLFKNTKASKKILFLDIPNNKYVNNFLYNSDLINQTDMFMIVHLGSSATLNSQSYLNWVRKYVNDECLHVYLDENHPCIDFDSIYEQQSWLNTIDSNIFPILPHQTKRFKSLMDSSVFKVTGWQSRGIRVIMGETKMRFEFKNDNNIKNDYMTTVLLKNSKSSERLKRVEFHSQSNLSQQLNDENDYPKCVVLGTASSKPSIYRNVSSIWVKMSKSSSMLLDCGHSTISQLSKLFGPFDKQMERELVNLNTIYITHYHSDHYTGILGVMLARYNAFKKLKMENSYRKLYLIYPKPLKKYLTKLNDFLSFDGDCLPLSQLVELIPSELFSVISERIKHVLLDFPNPSETMNLRDIFFKNNRTDLVDLRTVPVQHIFSSNAIILDMKNGFRLVYSGDCRPSNQLASFGQNCNLLIHECTFRNNFYEMAIKSNHSTLEEAIEVSENMNASFTLLTHFSAKYRKLKIMDHPSEIKRKNVCFAFDFMLVTPKSLPMLNAVLANLN